MTYDLSTAQGLNNAINWVENHLRQIRPGGVWIVPRSLSVYRVDRHAQRVTCVMGGDSGVDKVFRAMNWRVET